VSDNQGWPPPSDANTGPSASSWAAPGIAPAPSAQPIPAWQQQQQSTPGWTPPPKPGLIPLRPLSFGTIIGSSFRVMRRNPAPTFGLAVLLYGFITIVYVAIIGGLFALTFSRMSTASSQDQNDIMSGSIGLIAVTTLVPISLAVIATGLLQGIISLEVSRATLGEKLRVRGLWRLAKGRIGALIGWSLLLTAVIVVSVVVVGVASIAVFSAAGGGSSNAAFAVIAGGLLLSALFGLAFTVLGTWVGTKVSLVPSVIMLERLSLRASVARSWSLTRGNFWRTLGTQLLISVIISSASYIVSIPVSVIGGIVAVVINPNADGQVLAGTFIVLYVVMGILTVVVGAIGLVMQSAALALIYIDVRMRKEGLDLELLHYVEAKQAGTAGIDNPYLRLQHFDTARPATPNTAGSPWA
jgi:hypothetical protein